MRLARRFDVIAVVGLVAWLAFDLLARTVFGRTPWPESVVDYRILYDASQFVVTNLAYPAGYPYPPPAVAVHAASAVLPFSLAAALWLALTGLAAAACYALVARALELPARAGMLVALPPAHAVCAYYFQWDMRSVNCNLIVLCALCLGGTALAAGRDRAAGCWLALAVALKVMPVLCVPYLAWVRRWRALAWALGASAGLWVLVPLVAFGASGFAPVYQGWFGELTRATDATQKLVHPILISLDKAAVHLFGDATSGAKALALGVMALWALLGLAGAALSFRTRGRDPFAVLAHVSLLVIGPSAVNPYLEAYHLVPLMIPAVLLAVCALDARASKSTRAVALIGFAVAVLVVKFSGPWPLRGLLVNVQALVLCAAALWVTHARTREPDAPAEPRRNWLARLFARPAMMRG
jgi:hypothetical protein